MDTLRRDVAYALRRLVRAPGFTLIALLSLALGIGANTAIFSLVNAVILRPSALEAPDELIEIYSYAPDFTHGTLSYPDYVDARERLGEVFVDLATSRLAPLASPGPDGVSEMRLTELVSGNYFTLQGLDAAVGRTLLPEDDVVDGAASVVVLDHAFWERRYGGDPGIVGREIRLGSHRVTVVGVTEPAFAGTLRGLTPDLYAPITLAPLLDADFSDLGNRGNQSYFSRGRLRAGVGLPQVEAAAARTTEWLRETYPDYWQGDEGLVVVPTADVVVNPMIDRVLVPALGLLLAVVGVVLVIACANLASFLLARAADRKREVALRLALGAGRARLVRQLLTETVLLALVGGLGGVGLAWALTRALERAELPVPIPVTLDLAIDGPVLAFTFAISVAAGLVFGLTPALQATRPALAPTLKNEATGEPRRRFSLRNVLVVGQVALSLVLLVGAGLLLRSMVARQTIDPGFGQQPAAIAQISLTSMDRADAAEVWLGVQEFVRRVEALPGVGAVGVASNIHLNTLSSSNTRVEVDGVAPPPGRDFWSVQSGEVSEGLFDAMGLRVLEGRGFLPEDADGDRVVVVNEAFVDVFFPQGGAVGSTVRLGRSGSDARIVGVVNTAKDRSLGEAPRPYLYEPFARDPQSWFFAVASTPAGDARVTAAELGRIARQLDADAQIFGQTTMEGHLGIILFPARASAMAAGIFAALALALASIGLYGVVSYAVARRTREVGIRVSLGARAGQVVRSLMAEGLTLVAIGAGLGLALAAGFAAVIGRFLYGIGAFDPLAFTGMAALLLAVAVLAAWVPARRATRIDPVRALRSE